MKPIARSRLRAPLAGILGLLGLAALGLVAACGEEVAPAKGCSGPADCLSTESCENGVCVAKPADPCAEVSCAAGELCLEGRCFARSCTDLSCREGMICLDGDCVAAACAEVSCGGGEACAAGECHPRSCGAVSCGAGVCVAGGCQSRACVGVSCPSDQACANGACLPGDCPGQPCAGGEVCVEGVCTDAGCVGRSCADATICEQGVCREACRIDGAVHATGEVDPANDCFACQPAEDLAGWSALAAGSPCASPSYCAVETTCDGAGTCGGGQPRDCSHLDSPCELGVCDEPSGSCLAEPLAAGTGCGTDRECDGEGACVSRCALPWGGTIGDGESVTAWASGTVACGGSCESETRVCADGALSGTFAHESCAESCAGCSAQTLTWGAHGCQAAFAAGEDGASLTEANLEAGRSGSATFACSDGAWSLVDGSCEPQGCALPWGGTIAHLESVSAYAAGSVACGASCEAETRSCSYGVLSGSHLHQSCAAQCASCPAQTLTWGAHGCQAAFPAAPSGAEPTEANVAAGRSGSASFSCVDGTWSLAAGTCEAQGCALPWGGSIAHLESVTAYEANAVACGVGCVSESRRCSYGALSGTFLHQNCSPQCAGCQAQTLSWGADGCEAAFAAAGHGEESSATNLTLGRSGSATFACVDGEWLLASGTCEPDACALPWGGTIAHGASVTAWAAGSVACGGTCESEARGCSFGVLSGTFVEPACSEQCAGCPAQTQTWGAHGCEGSVEATAHGAADTASNAVAGRTGTATWACVDGSWSIVDGTCEPEACALPWGGTIAHGQSVTAYATSSVPCGGSCASEVRGCSYGTLSGSFAAQSCAAEDCAGCAAQSLSWGAHGCGASFPATAHGASATETNATLGRSGAATWACSDGEWTLSSGTCEPDACALPWGGTVAHGASVTAWAASTVACGGTCTSEVRGCSYGALSGSLSNQSCSESCASCPTQTLSWGVDGCQASFAAAAHGSSRTASNATAGRTGSATHACVDGSWQFTSGTCDPAACALPWGGTIAHGQMVTAYQSSLTTCADFCPSETRLCSYGALSGTFTQQSCSMTLGTACADGSIYAGAFGGQDYFTTPANLGSYTWNKGVNTWVDTGATSLTDGRANTTLLAGIVDAVSPYRAAVACHDLVAHGRSDWFLPAEDELTFLYSNRVAIGGFVDGDYWSSTEKNAMGAWFYVFPGGWGTEGTKNGSLIVRCVRR